MRLKINTKMIRVLQNEDSNKDIFCGMNEWNPNFPRNETRTRQNVA